MTNVVENLSRVRKRIERACSASGRDPREITLLAVSKTKPMEMVRQAFAAGQLDFGENYLQDATSKVQALPHARWHFIGQIQSNKTRSIAADFDWVHSLASEKIARRLNSQRESAIPINVLLQINVSSDPAKAGIEVERASDLLDKVKDMQNLKPRGLMTITENTEDTDELRGYFAKLRKLLEDLNATHDLEDFDQLSMGMTADLEPAITEGATIVRIGTAIFGQRKKKEQQ
ncbi:MAG TPA: YggS family pyridoxal phosphate-dependent enzyme [Gammaproteobacteria bacterium]|nr:YggS family pyridoxal phosphate-dependent enzyme [Gammaproteobacteria bacterium]|tara:strand:- start:1279 stop:1974 length:696 start_codon:yes stop_codon:yes gene_type:complete